MEDDALVKKNTDCVYFLASPLTCKKGNDCEFRHSESARVNPRDCRYWLQGNCLNWDCPFRHPPLEGRPTVAAAAAPGSGGTNKSRVPCYFFSQGFCAKGDKCQFMHGTPSVANLKTPAAQRPVNKVVPPVSAPDPNEKEKDSPSSNGIEAKSVAPVAPVEPQATEGRLGHVGGTQSKQKDVRTVSVSGATQNGGPRGRADGPVVSSGLVGSRLRLRQVQPGDDRVQNGMEPDEWWEESSPGFDVLVDDGPEQSHYPDDPEFQSAGETGLDSGKGAAGNRGRGGRSMRMSDDMTEQYDYDFPNPYDHPGHYEGGALYDLGGYEYNAHDHQGGYDPSNSYDRPGHQRASVYSDRAVADEMVARERLGLPMDVDMRSGGGAHDQRTRIVKRRRPEGGQQHVSDNHGRRQRTEMPMDEYQHHQRQQEDQQKQHELQLRHQLFMQHGMRNNNRRVQEKTGLEPGVIARRALHEIGASDGPVPGGERLPPRIMPKGRSMNEQQGRGGAREVDIHSRLSKATDGHGEPENRNFMDVEGNRKSDKEVKKDPSTFAGPKTLAQIRAEKRKGAVEEPSKPSTEASNGLKQSVLACSQSKMSSIRTVPHQAVPLPGSESVSQEAVSGEERKMKLEKVVGQEVKKLPSFEGPKSLSAILKEKRRVESEMDPKSEEAILNHFQRLSPPTSRVAMVSRVETVSALDSNTLDVQKGLEADVGYAEVEDGEFLSDDEDAKGRREKRNVRESHYEDAATYGSRALATRDTQLQDDAVIVPEAVEGRNVNMIVDDHSYGAGAEQNEEDLDDTDGHEFEEDVRGDIEGPEPEEDGYGLDDDDEDDFAKKLGGFFS